MKNEKLTDLERERIDEYIFHTVGRKGKGVTISDCKELSFNAMHLYVKRELQGIASEVLCIVLAIVLEAGKLDTDELLSTYRTGGLK